MVGEFCLAQGMRIIGALLQKHWIEDNVVMHALVGNPKFIVLRCLDVPGEFFLKVGGHGHEAGRPTGMV